MVSSRRGLRTKTGRGASDVVVLCALDSLSIPNSQSSQPPDRKRINSSSKDGSSCSHTSDAHGLRVPAARPFKTLRTESQTASTVTCETQGLGAPGPTL